MKILLHVCCGPCALYPLEALRKQGHEVEGYFYNPNIHPFREFKNRINALKEMAEQEKFQVEISEKYGLQEYLRRVVFHEQDRCRICYDMRMEQTAKNASLMGYDAFCTTLLYSRYQQHETIREKCEQLGSAYSIDFYYEDFRTGWQQGVDRSKEIGLYRQPYCGCIFSEQERYDKKMRKPKERK